jgi:hypothetical protein
MPIKSRRSVGKATTLKAAVHQSVLDKVRLQFARRTKIEDRFFGFARMGRCRMLTCHFERPNVRRCLDD